MKTTKQIFILLFLTAAFIGSVCMWKYWEVNGQACSFLCFLTSLGIIGVADKMVKD